MPLPVAAIPVAGKVLTGLFGLVDDLFTSDEERATIKQKLLEMDQKGQLAQIAVNLQEAKSENLFVSGWRPAIGWICGATFAYNFIIQPFALFIATVTETDPALLDTLPALDLGTMMPVLLGMLGLGGMRTYEKFTGTNKNR